MEDKAEQCKKINGRASVVNEGLERMSVIKRAKNLLLPHFLKNAQISKQSMVNYRTYLRQ